MYMNELDHRRERPGELLTAELVRISTASFRRQTDRYLLRDFAQSRRALEEHMRKLETKAKRRRPCRVEKGDRNAAARFGGAL